MLLWGHSQRGSSAQWAGMGKPSMGMCLNILAEETVHRHWLQVEGTLFRPQAEQEA